MQTALYEIAFIYIDVVIFWHHSFSLILPNYYSSLLDSLLDKPIWLLFLQPYCWSPLTFVITILCPWYVRGGLLITVFQLLSQAVRTSYLLLSYFSCSSTFIFENSLSMHLFNFSGQSLFIDGQVDGMYLGFLVTLFTSSKFFISLIEFFCPSLTNWWHVYDLLTVRPLNLDNQTVTRNSLPLPTTFSIILCLHPVLLLRFTVLYSVYDLLLFIYTSIVSWYVIVCAVVHCRYSCGNAVHTRCMVQVARHQLASDDVSTARLLTCPLCRSVSCALQRSSRRGDKPSTTVIVELCIVYL